MEEDDEMERIQEELSDLTPEELQKLKNKMGLKAFRRVFGGSGKREDSESAGPKTFQRANKNRPSEVSSKRKVGVVRELPGLSVSKKKIHRDPRFDDMSGEFRKEIFERDYSFVKDIKEEEKKKIKKLLKKEKKEEKKAKLKQLLNRMVQQEKQETEDKKKKKLVEEWKKKEKERVKEGKTPYFLKKSDKRKLELAEKFKEMKEKGQVKQYIQKKRKRNSAKDRKKLPDARPSLALD